MISKQNLSIILSYFSKYIYTHLNYIKKIFVRLMCKWISRITNDFYIINAKSHLKKNPYTSTIYNTFLILILCKCNTNLFTDFAAIIFYHITVYTNA